MRRFLLDTGIAGDYIDRRRGVFKGARAELRRGNRIGIGMRVPAQLAYGIELSNSRDRKFAKPADRPECLEENASPLDEQTLHIENEALTSTSDSLGDSYVSASF